MTKTQSPLLGFNTNVRHNGKLFHIQTEDSGVKHPHIITHLFADGGRILKSLKTSYAEHVGEDSLAQMVRALMKEQHKAMFIALRDGEFDALLDGTPPLSDAAVAAKRVSASMAKVAGGARSVTSSLTGSPASDDEELLERAATQAEEGSALFRPAHDQTSSPSTSLHARRSTGSLRSITPPSHSAAEASPPAPPTSRYGVSRPASIFASARPADKGTVFGEEAITDKSLDEVILSFLAEELDASRDQRR